MEIIYLYASALLIKHKENDILIDGLINDSNIIQKASPDIERNIMNREGDFRHVNHLLFSHKHDDHFDSKKIAEFKNRFADVNIITPDFIKGKEIANFDDEDYSITCYKNDHIEKSMFDIDHYSICVKTEDSCVFICGDADLRGDWFKVATEDLFIDALFVNPIHIASPPMREAIKCVNVGKIYVYHIPPKENDEYGYRVMAESAVKKVDFVDTSLLTEESTRIKL